MQPINTPTYLRLRDQIREDIVGGIWQLGSHVTLAELSSHYQVSNNPVREALLQLQGEGVVEMRMHRGAVIPAVDERYIDDLYRVRGALQVMLAGDAARKISADQIVRLKSFAEAHESAAASGDVVASVNANRVLHRFLDGIADNALAIGIIESRSSLVDAFRRAHGYGHGRLDLVVEQHRKLLRAVIKRDPERAARAALEHTESSRQDLLTLVRSAARP